MSSIPFKVCGSVLLLKAMCCLTVVAQTMPEQVLATDRPAATREAQTATLAVNGTLAEYLLHPGDTVTVSYRFTPEFDDTEAIGPDGRITFKNIGAVHAAGGTLTELHARVLQAAYTQLLNPELTVALKDFQRPGFVVGGEVQAPGKFELRGPTTVLQAILMAGGPKQDSAMGHVLLFRRLNSETAETHVLRLNHLTRHSIPDDLLLQQGDMILVRHDGLSSLERYVKVVNLGIFFNPFGTNGLY